MYDLTLIPTNGRDYKSKKALLADFMENLDFLIADMSSRYNGKPVNRPQIEQDGMTCIKVRYSKSTKVAVLKRKGEKWS